MCAWVTKPSICKLGLPRCTNSRNCAQLSCSVVHGAKQVHKQATSFGAGIAFHLVLKVNILWSSPSSTSCTSWQGVPSYKIWQANLRTTYAMLYIRCMELWRIRVLDILARDHWVLTWMKQATLCLKKCFWTQRRNSVKIADNCPKQIIKTQRAKMKSPLSKNLFNPRSQRSYKR